MRTRRELASLVIEQAFQMLADNVRDLRVDEALFVPPGGYRSTLGTLKHIAGWSHVYRSYAFEAEPRHWEHIDWPRGLRDTVEPSQSYLDEVIAWAQAAHTSWLESQRHGRPAKSVTTAPASWAMSAPAHMSQGLIESTTCAARRPSAT